MRGICEGKTEKELMEAEQNFQGLLLVIKEICDRLAENDQISEVDKSQGV